MGLHLKSLKYIYRFAMLICNGLDPKTRRNEGRRAESDGGVLGMGSEPLPISYGFWGALFALPAGSRAEPRKIWILEHFGPQKSRQNGQIAFESGEQQVNLGYMEQRRTAPVTIR